MSQHGKIFLSVSFRLKYSCANYGLLMGKIAGVTCWIIHKLMFAKCSGSKKWFNLLTLKARLMMGLKRKHDLFLRNRSPSKYKYWFNLLSVNQCLPNSSLIAEINFCLCCWYQGHTRVGQMGLSNNSLVLTTSGFRKQARLLWGS